MDEVSPRVLIEFDRAARKKSLTIAMINFSLRGAACSRIFSGIRRYSVTCVSLDTFICDLASACLAALLHRSSQSQRMKSGPSIACDGSPIGGSLKRRRSPSPPPWRKAQKQVKRENHAGNSKSLMEDGQKGPQERRKQESFAREQTRINQLQEAEQMRQWVSKEDEFVLKQSKKKAQIRMKEGRAKPIDLLAVTLSIIDPTVDLLEDDIAPSDLDIVNPEGVIDDIDIKGLQELEKDIAHYTVLESSSSNLAYWKVGTVIIATCCFQRLIPYRQ